MQRDTIQCRPPRGAGSSKLTIGIIVGGGLNLPPTPDWNRFNVSTQKR